MKIYHYTTFATFIDHILPKKRLRFNSLINTNDPKETNHSIRIEGDNLHSGFYIENFEEFTKLHRKEYCNYRSISFCSDKEGCSGLFVTSMWAHYGERHKGVCIEIDTDKLKDSEILYQGEIKYVPQIKTPPYTIPTSNSDFEDGVIETKIANHYRDNKDCYFFEKSECWSYEQEYRIIAKSSSAEDLYLDISEAMTCVYGGYDISQIRYDIIFLLTKSSNRLTYLSGKIVPFPHTSATNSESARVNKELRIKFNAFGGCETSFREYFKALIPRFDEIFKE